MSELCRVNWYSLLDERPPMLITGGLLMKTRIPGTAPSFSVSDRATSSAVMSRSSGVFQVEDQAPLIHRADPSSTADRRHEAVDVGILLHDGGGRLLVLDHRVVAGALGGLRRGHETALVLTRE